MDPPFERPSLQCKRFGKPGHSHKVGFSGRGSLVLFHTRKDVLSEKPAMFETCFDFSSSSSVREGTLRRRNLTKPLQIDVSQGLTNYIRNVKLTKQICQSTQFNLDVKE